MSNTESKQQVITFSVVSEEDRLNFLPGHFGRMMMEFESLVYRLSGAMIEGYSGGYWEFAVTSNGAPFMYLDNGLVNVSNPHGGDSYELNSDLAGLVVSAFALNTLLWRCSERGDDAIQEALTVKYEALMTAGYDIARQQGKGSEFFRLVD